MNNRAKIGIAGGIAGVVAIIAIITSTGGFSGDNQEFSSDTELSNHSSTYKINTECDLVNYLNDEENTVQVLSYVESNVGQFQARYDELAGDQNSSADSSSKMPDEEIVKQVFAEMISEEFSINPEIKNFLIEIQRDSPQKLVDRIKEIDPNCEVGEGYLNPKSRTISSPPNAGTIGSDHSHAGILVKIFGDSFDFSVQDYQIKTSWIHFEAGDGTTIHKHATGVTLGYLFESLELDLDDECFKIRDGRFFCTNEEYSLKFYINGQQVDSLKDYEIVQNDKILITYGAETPEEIESQLQELESQGIQS